MAILNLFKQPTEAEIINNKVTGKIYVADFGNGKGKYISASEYGSNENMPDVEIKISPRINLRLTYIVNNASISGIKIDKVHGKKIESITLSNFDLEKITELLVTFANLDLKSIANKTIILDESIIDDPEKVKSFLDMIALDPRGKEKLVEVAENYGLLKVGDIDQIVQKKEAVNLFEKILNSGDDFEVYKSELGVGKDEEVWQRFFSENSWILGTDFVEILDERRLDVENITDYLIKSYDGFVDIIELKLPTTEFWTNENIPKAELTKATMQCNRYILETERRMNDAELLKKLENIPIAKPRITLIYGRSLDWGDEQKEAYRVLNSSYTTLNIITFDHLLERVKRITSLSIVPSKTETVEENINPD
ncbi:MAG: DUF4263 domain-containing protein [Candidatus Pacebacteria bacterium]|nr:DUF4263 domain-containing protein [Candidatus Paceibacterota bacterium]